MSRLSSPWTMAAGVCSEHAEQSALFMWANRAMWIGAGACHTPERWADSMPLRIPEKPLLPELKWLHAIPNGGERSQSSAGNMKMEGVKAGVADVFWPVARIERLTGYPYHGLYIEMKRKTGKPTDLSDKQKEFRAFVLQAGYAWCWCRGWLVARERLIAYARGEWKQEYEAI